MQKQRMTRSPLEAMQVLLSSSAAAGLFAAVPYSQIDGAIAVLPKGV
jgi:hypothetical protein